MKKLMIILAILMSSIVLVNAQPMERSRILSIQVVDNVYGQGGLGNVIRSYPYIAVVVLRDSGNTAIVSMPYISIIEADVKDIIGSYLYETEVGIVIKSH